MISSGHVQRLTLPRPDMQGRPLHDVDLHVLASLEFKRAKRDAIWTKWSILRRIVHTVDVREQDPVVKSISSEVIYQGNSVCLVFTAG
jgi:hypothetical protein